jgi:hypothetical protein
VAIRKGFAPCNNDCDQNFDCSRVNGDGVFPESPIPEFPSDRDNVSVFVATTGIRNPEKPIANLLGRIRIEMPSGNDRQKRVSFLNGVYQSTMAEWHSGQITDEEAGMIIIKIGRALAGNKATP